MAQYQTECVETQEEAQGFLYGKFVLGPLERGQGTTVGNALRRVLLSNLEGAAVTAVRIAGVSHEFSTVPGVREDVMDILLNMKELVFHSSSPDSQMGRLSVQGPGIVTAAQMELPAQLEVVNSDHYLATLSEDATLEMEFLVDRGRGYRSVDHSNTDSIAVDFLQIDSVFMPVRKVNYSVEDAREGGSIEKDRLTLEIWTNGSITPEDALSQAAQELVRLFIPLQDVTFASSDVVTKTEDDQKNQIPIEELQLSVRAYNCLKRAQVNSVADLLVYSEEDLLEIKNFGQKSAEEVIEALKDRLNLTLPRTRDKSK
ncbi:DNA-directed RNA polymerase subunit alpha [Synechococcus sp. PCC 7336]|uniref:DNA-directed RNA polymerase subunit alpha n=1 Tax=Synechococcus sp. PCC 7336 TaxID=195250 RepID=UPI00034BD026|nr:DNA-directed RNA polymerase subunit alpha [Synechococcus sp. PCC 7336]